MDAQDVSDNYYSGYLNTRPNPRFEKFVRNWHERLLSLARVESFALSDGQPRVLEVGYGHGYFADLVVKRGWSYVAADISDPIIEYGAGRGHEVVRPENLDQDATFDVVWMSHVLEHSQSWEQARDMCEFYSRLLRPGGVLISIGPDYLSWKNQFWAVDFSHGYPTTRRNCVQLFNDLGLENIMATYHRSGRSDIFTRSLSAAVCSIPHQPVDWLVDRKRLQQGEGLFYSWKAMYGWRQLLISGLAKSCE